MHQASIQLLKTPKSSFFFFFFPSVYKPNGFLAINNIKIFSLSILFWILIKNNVLDIFMCNSVRVLGSIKEKATRCGGCRVNMYSYVLFEVLRYILYIRPMMRSIVHTVAGI